MNYSLGLDIGSHAIKLIELSISKDKRELVAAGSIPTPSKAMTSSVPADSQAVADAIKKLVKDTGARSRNVQIALPESKIFTRILEVPALSEREFSSAIRYEAEQYIPLPLDQVNLDFTVLRTAAETGTNKMEVLLVAAPKTVLSKYLDILERAELSALGAETEVIATTRALASSTQTIKNVMIVALGAQTTDLSIVHNGSLVFTRSVAAGGDALSRSLVAGLDFNLTQAEEYKKTYGLQADKLEGKIVQAVKPIMDTITNEMKRAAIFYREKYKNDVLQSILLSGGTSRLPGMVTYMAQAMGIEAQLANPWAGIAREPRFAVLNTEGPNFCVAVGLALRSES